MKGFETISYFENFSILKRVDECFVTIPSFLVEKNATTFEISWEDRRSSDKKNNKGVVVMKGEILKSDEKYHIVSSNGLISKLPNTRKHSSNEIIFSVMFK